MMGRDATVGDALKLLLEKEMRCLYVVENGRRVGRATQKSILGSSLDLVLSPTSQIFQF